MPTSQINLFLAKAKPEPCFKYFSKPKAFFLSLKAQYQTNSNGALLLVYLTSLVLRSFSEAVEVGRLNPRPGIALEKRLAGLNRFKSNPK